VVVEVLLLLLLLENPKRPEKNDYPKKKSTKRLLEFLLCLWLLSLAYRP